MRILEVIESKQYKNTKTGATASVYGCRPDTSPDWIIEVCGWTWRNDNGTVGLGRMPAKTREEAEQIMADFNARFAPKTGGSL